MNGRRSVSNGINVYRINNRANDWSSVSGVSSV